MTAAELLRAAGTFGRVRSVFRFPYVHLIVESERFAGKDGEERESLLAEGLSVPVTEIRRVSLGVAEQHRIANRVDELMTLCDQLESQITTAHAANHSLLEAVLHHALAVTA